MSLQESDDLPKSVKRLFACAFERFGARGPAAVAGLIQESPQTVVNWSRGRGVSKNGASKIEKNLGWSAMWILEGIGPQYIEDQRTGTSLGPSTILAPRLIRRVPVTGKITGERGALVIESFPSPEYDVAAFTGGEPSYALRVNTSQLAPRLRLGEHVIVAENGTLVAGEDVLVGLPDGGLDVMEFTRFEDAYVVLNDILDFKPRLFATADVRLLKIVCSVPRSAKLPPAFVPPAKSKSKPKSQRK